MTLSFALDILNKHNLWRKGDETIDILNPGMVGECIDKVIAALTPKFKTLHHKKDLPQQDSDCWVEYRGKVYMARFVQYNEALALKNHFIIINDNLETKFIDFTMASKFLIIEKPNAHKIKRKN